MASKAESKIDAAAEMAYAEAANNKVADKTKDASAAKVVETENLTSTPKKSAPAKKAAASKTAAPESKLSKGKTTAKAAKPSTKKKASTSPSRQARAAKPGKASTKIRKNNTSKDSIMSKTKKNTDNLKSQAKQGFAELQTRAKGAYNRGAELTSDMVEFHKGNAEAVVESAKIYTSGVQTIAKTYLEDSKVAVETLTADAKELAGVRSPTDFVQLQSKITSRNVDAAVAQFSKSTEAWLKLANDSFAPLSGRVSVAVEKVRKAA